MELTREKIEWYAEVSGGAITFTVANKLAKQLLAEMEKPKVWTGAPEWATSAMAVWYGKDGQVAHSQDYTRTLPKSRIDEIAEEVAREQSKYGVDRWTDVEKWLTGVIKSAILKDREERECVK